MFGSTCIGLILTAGYVTASSPSECRFYPGETVNLRCTTEPDHEIRLYRGNGYRDIIYSANTLRRKGATDDRYSVYEDGNGTVELSILAVKNVEAGIYRCQDMDTNAESSINLVNGESNEAANQEHGGSFRRCSFVLDAREENKRGPSRQSVAGSTARGSVDKSSSQKSNLPGTDSQHVTRSPSNWMSSDHSFQGFTIAVSAAIVIVVVVVLLVVIGCVCCKNRKLREEAKHEGYHNRAMSHSVDLSYGVLIKPAPPPVYALLQGDSNNNSTQEQNQLQSA